ncbi:glycerol-3-phosphate dehydrogenase/oxidase [Parasalinivibrio latis]|uniref:glycerol-3-phosphate dehydrogenase/oxidase n=1 Tax=Parasalinivibrio latis TaxID=2952610 RepID=UPI0030E18C77
MQFKDNSEAQPYDFLIIGGGISGASLAREAVLRGYSVALVDKNDFSAGTSSRSGKLIHGGVRYLETMDLKVVRESCRERETQLRIAPHLGNVQPILFVSNDQGKYRPWQLRIALSFYDFVSGNPNNRKSRIFSKKQLEEKEPNLNTRGLYGAGLFHDLATNDARLTIDTLKSAVQQGADVANYTEVTDLLYRDGKVSGVVAKTLKTGESFSLHAKHVINACGPGVDAIRLMDDPSARLLMKPSKGVHLAFRSDRLPINNGIFMHVGSDNGRMNWVLPKHNEGFVFAGATDTFFEGDIDNPGITEADIDHVLKATNEIIPSANLTRKDILSAWAGLRPLVDSGSVSNASKVSRRHLVTHSQSQLYTLAGGKLSTCRLMAEETIDYVEKHAMLPKTSPLSHITPISGGETIPAEQLNSPGSFSEEDHARIFRVFGSNATVISGMAPSSTEASRIAPSVPLTKAELRYILRNEFVTHLADLLIRRTNIFYSLQDGGLSEIKAIGELVAKELGWSSQELQNEITAYQKEVTANRHVDATTEFQTGQEAKIDA